jgi:predicted nucleic acid-binding protein
MSLFVVDASVGLKWLLPVQGEALIEEASSILRRFTRGEVQLSVPDLFWAEVGNAMWKAVRRGRATQTGAASALADLRQYDLVTVSTLPLLGRAFEMATAFGRTVYDCLYVALAVESGAELITADERLANSLAARQPVKWLGAI